MKNDRPIGIFDSGVGGVSVLRDMAQLLPHERFVYYGDNLNAPYGVRQEEEIRTLAMHVADVLLSLDVKALVVACNTATSAAVAQMREKLDIPVVGMEPALKPASQMCHGGKVLVLATPATLRQSKFKHLHELYGQNAIIQPCAGLMEFAEAGELEGEKIERYLEECFAPYRGMKLDVAVLGCTHYVFLRRTIQSLLPHETLVLDGNEGTVRQLKRRLTQQQLLSDEPAKSSRVQFFTSGNDQALALMRTLVQLQD